MPPFFKAYPSSVGGSPAGTSAWRRLPASATEASTQSLAKEKSGVELEMVAPLPGPPPGPTVKTSSALPRAAFLANLL